MKTKSPTELKIEELNKQRDLLTSEIELLENRKAAEGSALLLKKINGSSWDLGRYGDILIYKRNLNDLPRGAQDDKLATFLLDFSNSAIWPHGSIRVTDLIELRGDDGEIKLRFDPPVHDNSSYMNVQIRLTTLFSFAKEHNLVISYDDVEKEIKDSRERMETYTADLAKYKKLYEEA